MAVLATSEVEGPVEGVEGVVGFDLGVKVEGLGET